MTEEDQETFKINNICRFCEKNIESDKVGDHYHLKGKNSGPAQNTFKIKVIRKKKSKLVPISFHNLSIYNSHLFFKEIFDEKNDKVKVKIILKNKRRLH